MANTLADRQRNQPNVYANQPPADYGYSNAPKSPVAPTAPKPPVAPTAPFKPPVYYGKPPTYRPDTNFGPIPTYQFAPEIDQRQLDQYSRMESLIQQGLADEQRQREAELFQIRSQPQRPRQSRLVMLGGY